MERYIWNSNTNCFEGYVPEMETVQEYVLDISGRRKVVRDENGDAVVDENGNLVYETREKEVEKAPTQRIYSESEVNALFASRGANQVIRDVESQPAVVDLFTSEELVARENRRRVSELKRLLSDTDYIANKIAEALLDGDADVLNALKTEYAQELAQRKAWRAEINELDGGY